jgi:hypothetical protein
MVENLPDRAYQLALVFQSVVRSHRKGSLTPLSDAEIADAAGVFAATLETASRGIIYEHQAATMSAQRLVGAFKAALAEVGKGGGSALEREAALALRRIEDGAKRARESLDDSPTAFLEFLDRLPAELDAALRETDEQPAEATAAPESASRIILP